MFQKRERMYEENELSLSKPNAALTLLEDSEQDFQTYRIADLNVAVRGGGALMRELGEKYVIACKGKHFDIEIDTETNHNFGNAPTELDLCVQKVFAARNEFYRALPDHDGFVLHSSAVALDGRAYLFSAPSGTGKSTHASLWCEVFDKAVIINDDKPIIRWIDNRFIAYGAPWSGKLGINRNLGVPVQSIAFIEKSEDNWIKPLNKTESLSYLFNNAISVKDRRCIDFLLNMTINIIHTIPIYLMGCTASHDSVHLAHAAMSAG